MRTSLRPRAGATPAFAALLTMLITSSSASAQGFFPWEWKFGSSPSSESSNRKVMAFPPDVQPGQIIVSFTDRRLYYVPARGTAIAYPIATPRREDRWQGVLRVSRKTINPSWTPTSDMLRENPSLPAHVAGGDPKNPLGSHALYLGSTLYRIHGTDAPWTIGQPVSKGCVRMHNADVNDLYRRVGVGTKVTVTWQSFYTS